jgi:hypothetical protein
MQTSRFLSFRLQARFEVWWKGEKPTATRVKQGFDPVAWGKAAKDPGKIDCRGTE